MSFFAGAYISLMRNRCELSTEHLTLVNIIFLMVLLVFLSQVQTRLNDAFVKTELNML